MSTAKPTTVHVHALTTSEYMVFVSELWSCITQRAVTVVRCIYASVLFLSGFVSPTYFQMVLVQVVPVETSERTVTRHRGAVFENVQPTIEKLHESNQE